MQKTFESVEEKIKVTSLEIIVTMIKDKPYFEIKYKEVGEDYYHIGYSSFNLKNVLDWKEECFEIVNQVAEEHSNLSEKLTSSTDLEIVASLQSLYPMMQDFEEEAILNVVASVNNDGWIPCSKQLPSEKENPITNDYMQYPVMVNINGTVDLRYYYYGDGHWRYGFEIKDKYVTHWMDIKPYQPKICVNTECPYNENAECPAAEGCGGFEQK